MDRMTYAGSGVDYGALDPFKRRAQLAGRSTAGVLRRLGVQSAQLDDATQEVFWVAARRASVERHDATVFARYRRS